MYLAITYLIIFYIIILFNKHIKYFDIIISIYHSLFNFLKIKHVALYYTNVQFKK